MSFGRPEAESLERPITATAQLLVEGRSPEIFFREMVGKLNLSAQMDVRTFGSRDKDTLQTYLEIFTQKADFKEKVRAIGIIRDAEDKPAEDAFRTVCSALRAAGQSTPHKIRAFSGGPVKVGVFILPDCGNVGMLETLCFEIVQRKETADSKASLDCVGEFVECLKKAPIPHKNETKARLAAYLVAQGVYDAQVGRAAQKGVFPWNSPALEAVRTFLGDLAKAATN